MIREGPGKPPTSGEGDGGEANDNVVSIHQAAFKALRDSVEGFLDAQGVNPELKGIVMREVSAELQKATATDAMDAAANIMGTGGVLDRHGLLPRTE